MGRVWITVQHKGTLKETLISNRVKRFRKQVAHERSAPQRSPSCQRSPTFAFWVSWQRLTPGKDQLCGRAINKSQNVLPSPADHSLTKLDQSLMEPPQLTS